MPQILRVGPYSIYFWSNEGKPLEPIHVHISEGRANSTATKGSFNIRLSPDLHKKLFIYTTAHQMSMNKYIEDTLKDSPAARVIV